MSTTLEQIEAEAMQLSLKERSDLIHRPILSLEQEPEDSPEEVAKAWDAEIERRVAEMEAGRTRFIPADEVVSELRKRINDHRS